MERFGIFETVRVENGKPVLIDYHYRRMERSSRLLNLPFSLSLKEFRNRITEYAKNGIKLVRLTLFKSGKIELETRECIKRGSVSLLPVYSVKRCLSTLSYHKTIDIMDSLYALKEAKRKGFDEALLFNDTGFISETAFANIFFFRDGILFTPSLKTGCFPGTRREFIKDVCRDMGVPVVEGFFKVEEVLSADEVFITSAREDICPVRKIGPYPLKEVKGKPFYVRLKTVIEEVTFG